VLLGYSADMNYRANVDTIGNEGWTPLQYAAREGHSEVLSLLLDHGADANARTGDHRTALHLAAAHGRVNIVEVLLKRGADPHAQTDNRQTAFRLASGQYRVHMRRLIGKHTGEVVDPQSCVLM